MLHRGFWPVCIRSWLACLILILHGWVGAVEFPGAAPGPARSGLAGGVYTLGNEVISASWRLDGGRFQPLLLGNKLSGESFPQDGTEMFRLAVTPPKAQVDGTDIAIVLEADRVVAQVSRDGTSWVELVSFPRSEFPGEPRLVRLGKMNLKAQTVDHSGDPGAPGEGVITGIHPPHPNVPGGRFGFKTGAHRAATTEFPFTSGLKRVSCRIDKGTDQGMSWGPGIALVWEEGTRFLLIGVREKDSVFNITTSRGERIQSGSLRTYPTMDLPASAFELVGLPQRIRWLPRPDAVRARDRVGGVAIEAQFVSGRGIVANWRCELLDGANYFRQTVALSSIGPNVPLHGVELCDWSVPAPRTVGGSPGSPVAARGMFFGVEMPGAQNALDSSRLRVGFSCGLQVVPGQPLTFGSVAGVAPEGQLRRAFLCYIERERARPSRPFLHYNCWYDLGFSVDQQTMMDVVTNFDRELVKKRGVPVLSYLVDDGWDDPDKGLWAENTEKFPQGFRGLRKSMEPFGAHLGVWISPLGGYGGAKERTEDARRLGLIPKDGELDLAQPAYREWFRERCLHLMREDGVNAFKWDRAGEGVSPHFMALLDVARGLRLENPDLFVNVTVGTWPSPFWLNHVDSTWRNGSADVGWTGKGNDRERWLTFRDGYCHRQFVELSPLYPLNSVMHHGIVHGRCFQGEQVGKAGPNLRNEVRSYFANGAMLQELYITPSMMTSQGWDDLAEAAKWGHANADVLVDSHWIGGDPLKLEPYGYASWSPGKGTLMVRNPDDVPKEIALDASAVFELPSRSAKRFKLSSPYRDQRIQSIRLVAGRSQTVKLEPFEVLVFDAVPE